MGLFRSIKRAFKKVAKVATFGAYHGGGGGGVTPQPTPAPKLELTNPEGEAEEKKETERVVRKKGKKALKISKKDTPTVSTGRNIV